MKIRVLMCTEASFLNTGYSVYAKELLARLSTIKELDVAEFACYAHENDSRINTVPWKMYCNGPDTRNEEACKVYNSHELNKFGLWRFDEVCIDFKPHIVISIRDYWMDGFIQNSPFRKFFKWVWMATVDAPCQNQEWLDTYAKCDLMLTYNDWSGKTLVNEGGPKIKWMGEAPPAPSELFQPMDKNGLKKGLGFDENSIIFGTVMRNQRRKLFPDLFQGFRKFLNETQSQDTFLYCHTSYPEGWHLPTLLKENQLSTKVLFTYVCRNEKCNHVFPSFFSDIGQSCIRCNQMSALVSSVQSGPSTQVMSVIYNLFDYYIQYSNSEGFGVPMVEAAACGVPIIAMDFSAMTDVLDKLEGIGIQPKTVAKEIETGCERAVSDLDNIVDSLIGALEEYKTPQYKQRCLRTTQLCKEHYNWPKTVNKWIECFNTFETPNDKTTWGTPPNIFRPAELGQAENLSNASFAKWLIAEVLGQPEYLNSYLEARLTRDLNYGRTLGGFGGLYFNENSQAFGKVEHTNFTRQDAYNQMKALCDRRNYYEQKRIRG